MAIDRIDTLRAQTAITGIDFIQVSAGQTELTVFLLHSSLPPGLAAALAAVAPGDIHITGEGRVRPATVKVVQNVSPLPSPVDGRAVLKLILDSPGGFGRYRLRIDSPAIDLYFNNLPFSFKAACDSELDCKTADSECPPEPQIDFPVDYRARDFWSFRQVLIDFAARRYPGWQDRVEADAGMMVLELLAALGDEFAYAQDRLARESQLETATQRRSLRHLARLVDYPLDDGAGAFAWIDVEVAPSATAVSVPAGAQLSDAQDQLVFEIGWGLRDRPPAVPPAPAPPPAAYVADRGRNHLFAHIWDERDTCLPPGSTTLTLQGAHAALLQADPVIDVKGRWVLLRTFPPSPDIPERRLAVRLVEATDDTDPLMGVPITRVRWDSPTPFDLDLETLVLRGNLLPATSGRTHDLRFRIGPPDDPLDPQPDLPQAIERIGIDTGLCYPKPGSREDKESRVKLLFPVPGSDGEPLVWLTDSPASGTSMTPEIDLVCDDDAQWFWRGSLIGEATAGPDEKVFALEDGLFRRVVGFERLGEVTQLIDYASGDGWTIRFGNNEFGKAPPDGAKFTLRYRLGSGSRMNVAADSLTRLMSPLAGVSAITNPLAASGGRDPESAEQIRINAPQAFRAVTHRAVRPADYAAVAERLPWVQKAGAVSRWTGSWPTLFVTPDPRDETMLPATRRNELEQLVDQVRQAGREAKVMDPVYADIDLEIELCVAANAYRGEVKAAALTALFGGKGRAGFFHPDRFTFGMPLNRADLIAALQAVPGVRAVERMKLRRRGHFDWREFIEYRLPIGVDELVRVANDADVPERGAVRLIMRGGA